MIYLAQFLSKSFEKQDIFCYTICVNTGRNVMATLMNYADNAFSFVGKKARKLMLMSGVAFAAFGCGDKGGEPTPVTPKIIDATAIAEGAKISIEFDGAIAPDKPDGVNDFFGKINIDYPGFSAQLARTGQNFSVSLENAEAHEPTTSDKGYFTAKDKNRKASLNIKSLDPDGFGTVTTLDAQKKIKELRIEFDVMNTNVPLKGIGKGTMQAIMDESIENQNNGSRPNNKLDAKGFSALKLN